MRNTSCSYVNTIVLMNTNHKPTICYYILGRILPLHIAYIYIVDNKYVH